VAPKNLSNVIVGREVRVKRSDKGLTSGFTAWMSIKLIIWKMMFEKRPGDREKSAPRAATIALLGIFLLAAEPGAAADVWGGSLAVTSDYFVRGISRSNDQATPQLDLHYSNSAGLLAGVFASNTQINSFEPRNAELSAFIGFAWSAGEDWRTKILVSHYAYPWNNAGTQYNYDELDVDLAYQGWLHLSVGYSPNSPRYVPYPYDSLLGVTEKSAEVSLQRPVVGKLSATAGVGYSHLGGPFSGGYTYWSVGGSYDLQAVSLVLSYVDTSAEAKSLFYNEAATGRWTGTVIWRF
jgi:uncharacterized protein (TIGR02001 family)